MQFTSFICWALKIAAAIDSDFLSGVILFGGFNLSITIKALLFDASVFTLTLLSEVLRAMLKLQTGMSKENTTRRFQEVLIRFLIMININILKLYTLAMVA